MVTWPRSGLPRPCPTGDSVVTFKEMKFTWPWRTVCHEFVTHCNMSLTQRRRVILEVQLFNLLLVIKSIRYKETKVFFSWVRFARCYARLLFNIAQADQCGFVCFNSLNYWLLESNTDFRRTSDLLWLNTINQNGEFWLGWALFGLNRKLRYWMMIKKSFIVCYVDFSCWRRPWWGRWRWRWPWWRWTWWRELEWIKWCQWGKWRQTACRNRPGRNRCYC